VVETRLSPEASPNNGFTTREDSSRNGNRVFHSGGQFESDHITGGSEARNPIQVRLLRIRRFVVALFVRRLTSRSLEAEAALAVEVNKRLRAERTHSEVCTIPALSGSLVCRT